MTNQRETLVAWSRSTGKCLYNAIVWSDSRTEEICSRITTQLDGDSEKFKSQNGLSVSTYFSLFKLKWLLKNVEAVQKAYDSENLMVGTIETWVIYNFDKKQAHLTDVTNASRTFLMNLKTQQWDPEIIKYFKIKKQILPEIVPNVHHFGQISVDALFNPESAFNKNFEPKLKENKNFEKSLATFPKKPDLSKFEIENIDIVFAMGDQQAASLGLGLKKGGFKITYGTGCFMIRHTGKEAVNRTGLLTTVMRDLGEGHVTQFGLEGAVEAGAATINFLKDNLSIFTNFKDADRELLSQIPNKEKFFPDYVKGSSKCYVGSNIFLGKENNLFMNY